MSAKKRSETDRSQHPRRSKHPAAPDGKSRKQRSGELGRALRSIYDDTLREPVPDDFLSIIGKLS
ncbi:MAG: NepR family anti-sigma factor [Sphingomicrobium sp.]